MDLVDVVLILSAGAIAALGGIAFRSLPAERQQRWRRPFLLICGVVIVLGIVLWFATIYLAWKQFH